jgi:hypothetical protein
MSTTAERVRPFHWNAGAWFGSQLGGTAWMLVGSGVLLMSSFLASSVWAGSFVLANALGLTLWANRGRLGMYAALQILLIGIGLVGLASMAAADWCGQLPALMTGSPNPRLTAYAALLVVPGMMVLFWSQERIGRVANGARAQS